MPEDTAKYTPGPWGAVERDRIIDIFAGDRVPARINDDAGYSPEARANARLIAAAPELLEACRDLVFRFEHMDDLVDADAINVACAAIAKATIEG